MERFKPAAEEIRLLVSEWEIKLKMVPDNVAAELRNSRKRSIKQILGHMVDSVTNNTHRLVFLQYNNSPFEYPNYATFGNNDKWIAIQNYQEADWNDLVQLWKYTHLHFAFIIRRIPPEKLDNEWIAGENEKITLEEMIQDFPRHFKLHLNEINHLLQSENQ